MQTLQASSYPFIPLSASYLYDDFDMYSHLQQWDDGSVTIDTPILNNIKDVVANKNTLMYMTSSEVINSILEDKGVTIEESIGNGTIGLIADNGNYVSVDGTTLSPTASSFGETETFGLIVNDDNTVSFLYKNSYVGVEPAPPWNVVTTNDANIIDKGYHKFNIIQNGSKYLIQTMPIGTGVDGQTPPLFERYLKPIGGNGILRATGTTVIPANLFTLSTITPGGGVIPGETFNGLEGNTWWMKYFNTVNNQNGTNQTVDVDFDTSLSGIKLNYLVTNAYKTKINKEEFNDELTIGNMNIDISNLKTIETPSYEYTERVGVSGSDSVGVRDYSKIFTGTNQEYGYEQPFLGFSSNTTEVIFPVDKITYFHFPNTANITPLSSVGITEAGAVAGSSPFRSDKIWKKNANYKKNIWWGDSLQWQQGTWLCSWLSGSLNSDTKPVWKDRWYNAGYVTYQQAITSYQEVFVANDPIVIDVDSSMTLDPRVWYKYHHIGNDYNQTIVNTLTGDGTALKLHYDDWSQSVQDKSPFNNDGILRNYSASMIGESKIGETVNGVLVLDGINQYCYVPYNSSYDVTDAISHSVWVNTSNWSNVDGNHILSNNFRGGWSLEWTNGFVNYIYPTYESVYGHIIFTNIDDTMYADKLLPVSGATFGTPTAIAVDKDMFTWVLDDGPSKSLFKLDYNSDIVAQKEFDSTENLKDVLLDGNDNIWVLGNSVSSFKTTLEPSSGLSLAYTVCAVSTPTNIDIDANNTVMTFDTEVCIDNNNSVWTVSGGDVYNEGTLTLSGISVTTINCDKDNNIWVLNDNNKFTKLDNNGTPLLSGEVTTNTDLGTRRINFLNLYTGIEYKDYAMIIQGSDRTVYKYDMDGTYISNVDLSDGINLDLYATQDKTLMEFDGNGDFTGYDWNRKFSYIKYDKTPQVLSKVTTRNGDDLTETTLNVPATSLSDGWHHFVTTYEGTSGSAKFYVDTFLTDTESTLSASEIYYQYDNAFNIGVKSGIFRDLSDEIGIDDYYFKGSIDDVRIYDWEINSSDINNIYMTRFEFSDLLVNMPTGDQNYLEEVERFFKNKLPGLKSQYFNIRLVNLGVTDLALRTEIENIIKNTISKVAPAHSELYKIIWD